MGRRLTGAQMEEQSPLWGLVDLLLASGFSTPLLSGCSAWAAGYVPSLKWITAEGTEP